MKIVQFPNIPINHQMNRLAKYSRGYKETFRYVHKDHASEFKYSDDEYENKQLRLGLTARITITAIRPLLKELLEYIDAYFYILILD